MSLNFISLLLFLFGWFTTTIHLWLRVRKLEMRCAETTELLASVTKLVTQYKTAELKNSKK